MNPTDHIERINPRDINLIKLHRLAMIQNAIDDGWRIEKRDTSYIFSKPHEQQSEVFEEDYLNHFLCETLKLHTLCK